MQDVVVECVLRVGGEPFEASERHGYETEEAEGHGDSPEVV